MENTPHIVIIGNPVEGLEFIGPFASNVEAAAYGNADGNIGGDWWIAALQPKDGPDPRI